MSLELYFSPGACSRVPLIALEEAGLAFTPRPVILARGEQRQAHYLRLNPKGKVPLLVADGQALSENVAILWWIAQRSPEARLWPRGDVNVQASMWSMLAWCASGLHPLVTRLCASRRISPDAAAHAGIQQAAAEALCEQLAIAEQHLMQRDWWFGEWTVADAYLFWVWSRVQAAPIELSPFVRLAGHALRMRARPAVQRALAHEAGLA